jgi:hypothetical protein
VSLTVLKIALVAFLVIAVAVIVVVFARNVRRNGFPAHRSSSHYDQMRGATPPTPRPEWADWEEKDGRS